MKTKTANARRGLLAGGNWIIDQVKIIDAYPARDHLANIRSQSQGTGGSPYNVLVDLANLQDISGSTEFRIIGSTHAFSSAFLGNKMQTLLCHSAIRDALACKSS